MGAGALGAARGIRMAVRLRMTARKLMPLIRKQVPSPTAASSSPAMAGPTTRAGIDLDAHARQQQAHGVAAGRRTLSREVRSLQTHIAIQQSQVVGDAVVGLLQAAASIAHVN